MQKPLAPPPIFLRHFDDQRELGPLLVLGQQISFLGAGEPTLRAEPELIDVDELGCRLDAALDVVLALELSSLRCHQAEHDFLAFGHEPQWLKAASALGIVFHKIGVDVGLVEKNVGDRVVPASALKSRAEIATAKMHAGYHVGRLVGQRDIGRLRVKLRQLVDVVSVLNEKLSLLRINEDDHVNFVELQIATAGVPEGAHDLTISLRQIGVEFVERAVDRSVDNNLSAVCQKCARRWDGHFRLAAFKALYMRRRESLDVIEVSEEIAAPEAAPIFPIGYDLQSERFLFANGSANGLIFDVFQVGSAAFLPLQFRSCILYFLRTQQAADMFGAKWWFDDHRWLFRVFVTSSSHGGTKGSAGGVSAC